MKDLNQFYLENIEIINKLEDDIFKLTLDMDKECGKQSSVHNKLNKAWSALYEIRESVGDVDRVRDEINRMC